jgi:predicted GNAT family N-acyltransferase
MVNNKDISVSQIAKIQVVCHEEYEFRKLVTEKEVRSAEKLLYDVYVLETGWVINSNNKSGLKIEKNQYDGSLILTDDFSHKAHWFGAFHKKILVACFRVLEYSNNEFEYYHNLPEWKESKPCELNRLAVANEYRKKKFIMLVLMRVSFEFAFNLSATVFVTAQYPKLSHHYSRLGLIKTGILCKYNDDENYFVELLYYNSKTDNRYSSLLYIMTDKYMLV